MFRRLIVCVALACVPAMAGCFVEAGATTETNVPARLGSITLRWSVDGSFDPAACDAFAVRDARVDIYDASGQPISTTFVDCRSFTARFDLSAGQYSARLQMVDSAKQPRSTSLEIRPFVIVAGTNLNQESDFPRDSFF